MFDPNSRCSSTLRRLDTDEIEFTLTLSRLTLAETLHVLCAVQVNQSYGWLEGMHRKSLIELMLDQLNFLQLHRTITVHVGNLIVVIQAEVGAWNNLPNLEEVQTFKSDRGHLFLIVLKVEFVEAFTLLIDLDPSVIAQISEDFVFGLQAKLLAKFAT